MSTEPKTIKFIYLRTILASIFIGLAYGFITHFNPYIYLNILVLVVVAAFLFFLANHAKQHGKSVNSFLGFIYLFISCIVAWLTSWAVYFCFNVDGGLSELFKHPVDFFKFIIHYAQHTHMSISKGSSFSFKLNTSVLTIFYVIELIIFIIPAFTSFGKNKNSKLL